MQGRIESSTDFRFNKYWTMYLNGHFYHLLACMEDWFAEETTIFGRSRYSHIAPGKVLYSLNTLFSVTEIYEFAIRLAQKNVFGRRVRVKVDLHGTEERKIASSSPLRLFPIDYVCREKDISVPPTG